MNKAITIKEAILRMTQWCPSSLGDGPSSTIGCKIGDKRYILILRFYGKAFEYGFCPINDLCQHTYGWGTCKGDNKSLTNYLEAIIEKGGELCIANSLYDVVVQRPDFGTLQRIVKNPHTITIDDQTITISEESYKELKKAFNNGGLNG